MSEKLEGSSSATDWEDGWMLEYILHPHTRSVWKVSTHAQGPSWNHFEYLQNQLNSFDVSWQPLRKDLTAHVGTDHRVIQSTVRCHRVGLSTMCHIRCGSRSAYSSHFMQGFLIKYNITQAYQPPYITGFGSLQLLAFHKAEKKLLLNGKFQTGRDYREYKPA